jgi:hypothetical protein
MEATGHGLIEALSRHLPGATEENFENRIACVLADIRTEHLQDINLERNHYIDPVGEAGICNAPITQRGRLSQRARATKQNVRCCHSTLQSAGDSTLTQRYSC